MIQNPKFYCNNKDTYPPFKNGLYLEEYFLQAWKTKQPVTKRTYLPALWTNFQIESWFGHSKDEMQRALDAYVRMNPNPNGYFTIVQHDDGPQLKLPDNTVVYGACSGHVPVPLIYEDRNGTLEKVSKRSFDDKPILCSFVGNITANSVVPNVRQTMFDVLRGNPKFHLVNSGGWTPVVSKSLQDVFLDMTPKSKFALAPRGYGRSSFRFFEIFKLGTIPVYIYNDANWLPFQDRIDYSKLCIVIHVSKMSELPNILESVTREQYQAMQDYYKSIETYFSLEGMYQEIIRLEAS